MRLTTADQRVGIGRAWPLQCEDELVWAHPLDVWYSVSTLEDWPQLLVSVWQQDDLDRHEIAGYGVARLPTCPGVHFLDIVTWRPEGTRMQEIAAWFRGGLPQLTDTSVVTGADQRYLLRTVSTGTVQVGAAPSTLHLVGTVLHPESPTLRLCAS